MACDATSAAAVTTAVAAVAPVTAVAAVAAAVAAVAAVTAIAVVAQPLAALPGPRIVEGAAAHLAGAGEPGPHQAPHDEPPPVARRLRRRLRRAEGGAGPRGRVRVARRRSERRRVAGS